MSRKDKRSKLEKACDDKLDEIAEELSQTNCAADRIKVLTANAEELKKCRKTRPTISTSRLWPIVMACQCMYQS